VCCVKSLNGQGFTKVSADSLISGIDKYNNTKVEVEGQVVHICGVDGRKMKLMTEAGGIIKIVPKDSLDNFDESLYKQRIKVQGIAKELRIEKSYIDNLEKDRTLLCHIDHTPCKDSVWVKGQKEKGAADGMSKQDIERLRNIMKQTGKSYVSVVTIYAEKVEVIVEEKK
jgi:hypothetical protein